ncbi:hypothetical protein [Oceanithermus sp.]
MSCGAPEGGWQSQQLNSLISPGEGLITFQVPEPVSGFSERLFSDPEWKDRFYQALGVEPSQFSIKCIEQETCGSVYGEPICIWQMRFSTSMSGLSASQIADALSAGLDKPNFTEIVQPTVTPTALYAGHETENPFPSLLPSLGDIMNSFESAAGQIAALALLALAVVFVSRLWSLGGMALLAVLLIMVMNNEGGVINAQA